jgi:hypothetical protein
MTLLALSDQRCAGADILARLDQPNHVLHRPEPGLDPRRHHGRDPQHPQACRNRGNVLCLYDLGATGDGLLGRNRRVEPSMTTGTISISSAEDTKARMLGAFRGEEQGAFIGFATDSDHAETMGDPPDIDRRRASCAAQDRPPGRPRREIRAWRYSCASQGRHCRPCR